MLNVLKASTRTRLLKWFEKSEKCVELLLFGLFEIQFQSTRQIFNLEETNFQFRIYHVAPEARDSKGISKLTRILLRDIFLVNQANKL